jgi:hypothetical protein
MAMVGLVMVGVGLAGACAGPQLRAGEARITAQNGEVLVAEPGQALKPADGRILAAGARIEVVSGSATLALADGPTLEVRQGSEVVLMGLTSPPTLVAGELLVVRAAKPLRVQAGGSQVFVEGTARLSRDLAVTAASYGGEVTVESAGRSVRVGALRQASIASLGMVPAEPQALRYRLSDPWDRRFLGAAMDLSDQLEARSRGLSASLGPSPRAAPSLFAQIVPALSKEPTFDASLLGEGPPGEALVGATIALSGRRGAFVERWQAVTSFRGQGAAWGLVALDQGVVNSRSLIGFLDDAIGRAPLAFAAPVTPPAAAQAGGQRSRATSAAAAGRLAPGQPAPVSPQPAAPTGAPPATGLSPAVDSLVEPLVTDRVSCTLSRAPTSEPPRDTDGVWYSLRASCRPVAMASRPARGASLTMSL